MIRLYFRASEYRGFSDFLTSYPDYYRITEYPEAEMLGQDPVGWATDFVRTSNTLAWQQCARRPVQPGDIMVCKDTVWLFVASDDPYDSSTALPDYPNLAIREIRRALSLILLSLFQYTGAR